MKSKDYRLQARSGLAHFNHEINRFETQLQFAEGLCDLHPDQAPAWRPLMDKAAEIVAEAAGEGNLVALRDAVRKAESHLAPLAKSAKNYAIHLAGHAHIDMNWMWSWPETVSITVDTFSTMLKLMEEFPEFRFSQSQASVYAILEKHRPDLLKKIAARVREGRWEVTASHWVETDKNMAGAEALCRHLLYTRRYMQKLFGLAPEDVPIDWSPDTFGHAATVPTYLAQGGVKFLYMHRPGDPEVAKMWLFRWAAPDGARVLVRNDTPSSHAYNGEVQGPVLVKDCLAFCRQTRLQDHLFIFGVGDHGGGPTRRDMLQILEMRQWPVFPRLEFDTVVGYMSKIDAQANKLPVIERELNFEFTGCYTTETLIKKVNRLAENRLADAETAAALSWSMTGSEYPGAMFEEAWRDTLFSHFHDILPGSGVHDTRTYTHGLFQKTAATTAQIETHVLRELARRVDTSRAPASLLAVSPSSALCNGVGGGVGYGSVNGAVTASEQSAGNGPRPFVVFNPLLDDRDEMVEATIWDNSPTLDSPIRKASFVVQGPDGRLAPAQIVNKGHYWRHEFVTLAFRAKVRGGGYALYTILEDSAPSLIPSLPIEKQAVLTEPRHHCVYAFRERADVGLENEFLAVSINPVTGGIRRLTDKKSGLDLITPEAEAPALEYTVERPHGMTAWLIQHPGSAPQVPVLRDLRRTQTGPLKAALEADLRIEQSDFTMAYELRAGDPRLYVRISGVWFQRGTKEIGIPTLAFALPLALEKARARYEIPFGAVDRTLHGGEEVPALQWAQVLGRPSAGKARKKGQAGLLLLNDSKHGHSLDGTTLRLTLIRSSYDPDILPEIGQHEINLALQPFGGDMTVPEAIRAGQAFNRGLKVAGTDVHPGDWPSEEAILRQADPAILVSGVKRSEDGGGLIVRVFNPSDTGASARLTLHPDLAKRVRGVEAVDLMERPVKGSITWKRGTAVFPLPAFGLGTVLFRLTPGTHQ
jgi:alpha-mannosidase